MNITTRLVIVGESLLSEHSGSRSGGSLKSRPAWPVRPAPGQTGLQGKKKTLSKNKTNRTNTKGSYLLCSPSKPFKIKSESSFSLKRSFIFFKFSKWIYVAFYIFTLYHPVRSTAQQPTHSYYVTTSNTPAISWMLLLIRAATL